VQVRGLIAGRRSGLFDLLSAVRPREQGASIGREKERLAGNRIRGRSARQAGDLAPTDLRLRLGLVSIRRHRSPQRDANRSEGRGAGCSRPSGEPGSGELRSAQPLPIVSVMALSMASSRAYRRLGAAVVARARGWAPVADQPVLRVWPARQVTAAPLCLSAAAPGFGQLRRHRRAGLHPRACPDPAWPAG
jgi:hypothetical protein